MTEQAFPVQRFATADEACAYAQDKSEEHECVVAVHESPDRIDWNNPLRFTVSDETFTRSWERLVAVYEEGVKL